MPGAVFALASLFSLPGALSAVAPPPAPASIAFNSSFGSYMVLQQEPAQACVYGTMGQGGKSATVSISPGGYSVPATLVGNNEWKACLRPTQAGGDYTITAKCNGCSNATSAVLEHVVFGDVWYCGGQSNMALSMLHSLSRNDTRDAILKGKYSNIRIHGMEGNMNPFQPWTTLQHAQTSLPLPRTYNNDDDQFSDTGPSGCTPNCVPGTNCSSDCSALMAFSASCYYFGEALSDQLASSRDGSSSTVAPPIGLIHTAWGGSAIEQWLTNDTVETCEYAKTSESSQEWHDQRVLPYVNMTVKGFTWYQGENDMFTVKGNSAANAGYSCLMQALVQQWRELWSATPNTTNATAPFGIVTLATTGTEGANSEALGAMRQAQTAGYGVLPTPAGTPMQNTFLAQAYDLDDEWVSLSGGGPCMDYGYNASSPAYHCCGADANASLCVAPWTTNCENECAAMEGTSQYMGGLHPRSKRPVGKRLATAAFNLAYWGTAAFTGPTLNSCAVDSAKATLTIEFNKDLLRGDKLVVQKFSDPIFTPYFHGKSGPALHGGSQLYVQTVASSFCIEPQHLNASNGSSPVYCPTWAGGVGNTSTRAAPQGRFPSFGGNGMTTDSDPNQFNEGWINLPIAAGPTPTSIAVDLSPLGGKAPTAVRYAWGTTDCCDLGDPNTYSKHGCIANCPVVGSSGLPANPFMAKLVGNKCECVAPQNCS